MEAKFSPAQERIMRHALGLEASRVPYRNGYKVGFGDNERIEILKGLVDANLMRRRGSDSDGHYYCVTELGAWMIATREAHESIRRLHAAAPDLLDAAQQVLDALERWADDADEEHLNGADNLLRSAIERATGGAS